MNRKRVLVVDDEKTIVKGIKFSLEQDNLTVDVAYNGIDAIENAKVNKYDIIILDVMLPGLDGFAVCQQIREFSVVPIIMLTAKSDDIDKILGLEYGADDYLTKPFNVLELKARIKAIFRREQLIEMGSPKAKIIKSNEIAIDKEAHTVYIGGNEVPLTSKEFDLMELFVAHPNKVYSREDLLSIIWGYEYPGDLRTVDVHVRRLREKVEPNPSEPSYIHTKWGVGYYYKQV